MNRIRTIILIMIFILLFSLGTSKIKALPVCDFDNYGTFELRTQKEVNKNDSVKNSENNVVTNRYTSDDSAIIGDNLGGWSNQELKFYHVYAMQGGYINTAKFTIYSDGNGKTPKAQCEYSVDVKKLCEETEGQTCEVFKFMFTLNKAHVKQIEFTGTYFDANGNGPLDFSANDLTVNKSASNGYGVDHTTVPGKAIQNPIQKHIDSGKELGAAAGTKKGNKKNKTDIAGGDSQTACNSANDLFDYIWPYVMIILPIILMVMITLDFFKAMASNEEDSIKKAGGNAVKRTIALVILLALPVLLRVIFEWFSLDFCL